VPEPDSETSHAWHEISHAWHGTPELFAHVIRAIQAVTSPPSQALTGTVLVDVQVGEDHELFFSAEEFLTRVTPEALRRFNFIEVSSTGPDGSVRLGLAWVGTWWRTSSKPGANVVLELSGAQDWLAEARPTVTAALSRGKPTVLLRSGPHKVVGSSIGVVIGLIAAISISLLLGFSLRDLAVYKLFYVLVGVSGSLGASASSWVFPELEIAAAGGRRFWRFLKVVGPVLVALAVAGVSKRLFG
jgi:hypothetical protein